MKLLKILDGDMLDDYKNILMNIERDKDEFYSRTPHRLLDNFSHTLTIEEMEDISFDFRDLNLQNEYKYLKMFKQLFAENNKSKVIAKFDYSDLGDIGHLQVINKLDYYEKHIWVDQMVQLNNSQVTNYFIVDDVELLMMLTQLNVRELEFVEIHFIDLGYVIRGTFDCAMEVFFYDETKIQELELIASSYDLYLREYNKWEDT